MRLSKRVAGIFLLPLFFVSLFSSCKLTAPSFKTIDNVRFETIGAKGLKLGADITFQNPNPIKCRILDIDINLVLDEKLIGMVGEKSDVVGAYPVHDWRVRL